MTSSYEHISFIYLFISQHNCGYNACCQGYRTLDELKASGQLNRQQLIGLAHYDEFLERMPRAEAGEIEQKVYMAYNGQCIYIPNCYNACTQ